MVEPQHIAAGAACVAALAAVWSAYNGKRTLNRADKDRVERSRPVLAAEFRIHPYSERTLLLSVKNYGQTVARNVQVRFTPEIVSDDKVGAKATLVKKFDKPISVFAPGAELETIYFTPNFTDDGVSNHEDLPDEIRVTISYDGPLVKKFFGFDKIERYEDSFDLDTIPVRARVWLSSSTEPSARLKEINKSLKSVAAEIGVLRKVVNDK